MVKGTSAIVVLRGRWAQTSVRHDGELWLQSTTATAVSSSGEGENEEGVRGGARAGRGRGLDVQFIEEGGDERGHQEGKGKNGHGFKSPSMVFMEERIIL
jgi:hypothetical protein